MHIEQTLLLKNWRKEKKWIINQLMILWIVISLITGLHLAQNANSWLRQEKRWDYYGQWELADTDGTQEDYWKNNRYVLAAGVIQTAGIIHGSFIEGDREGIGVIDATAVDLGHLKLRSGHWPENAEEIVLEESTLQKLKLSDTPGARINLRIGPMTGEGTQGEARLKKTYILCGVLEDYRNRWEICQTHVFPTALIHPEAAAEITATPWKITLIRTNGTWDPSLADGGSVQPGKETSLYYNRYAYGPAAAEAGREAGSFFTLTWIGAAALLLGILAGLKTWSRRDLWEYLYTLGTSRWVILRLVTWEWLFLGIAGLAGGLAGGGLCFLISRLWTGGVYEGFLGNLFSPDVLAASAGMVLVTLLPGMLASAFVLSRCLSHRERVHRPPRHREEKLSVVPDGKITPAFLLRLSFERQPVSRWLLMAAAWIFMGTVSGFLLFSVTAFRKSDSLRQPDGAAVTVDLSDSDEDYFPESGISEDQLKNLESVLGVDGIQAVTWSKARGVFRADLRDHTGPYYEAVTDYMTKKKLDQMRKQAAASGEPEPKASEVTLTPEDVPVGVIGLNRTEDARRYLRNAVELEWDERAFKDGTGAILLVPDAYYYPRYEWFAPRLPASEQDYQSDLEKETAVCRDEFEVGDTINVRYINESTAVDATPTAPVSVKILGIVHRMKDTDCWDPMPKDAYTLVTGADFYRNFRPWKNSLYFQNLRIYMDEEAGYAQTERRVQDLLSSMEGVEIENYRGEWEEAEQTAWRTLRIRLIPVGLLEAALTGWMVWIWYRLRTEQERKIRLLRKLGMGKRRLIQEYRWEVLLYLGSSIGVSLLVLLAGMVILSLGGSMRETLQATAAFAARIPWLWYLAICAGWCTLDLLLYYIPLVKLCREEEWRD